MLDTVVLFSLLSNSLIMRYWLSSSSAAVFSGRPRSCLAANRAAAGHHDRAAGKLFVGNAARHTDHQ